MLSSVTFVLLIKEDADAEQLEKDLRESRTAVRAGFNEAAHAIEMHFDQATRAYVASTVTAEIEAVDRQLRELRELQQERTALFHDLIALLEGTHGLIREIHADAKELVRLGAAPNPQG